jgi:hypothetical protein
MSDDIIELRKNLGIEEEIKLPNYYNNTNNNSNFGNAINRLISSTYEYGS